MFRFYEIEDEYALNFEAAVYAARAAWAVLPRKVRAATVAAENRQADARPLGDRYHVVYGTPMKLDLEDLDEETLTEFGITCEADVIALKGRQLSDFLNAAYRSDIVIEDDDAPDIRLPITESDAYRKLTAALERHPEMQRYDVSTISLHYEASSDCYEANLEPRGSSADGATFYVAADDSRIYAHDDSQNEIFEEANS